MVRGPRAAAAALVVGECLEDVGQLQQARQPGPAGLAQRLTLPHRLLHLDNTQHTATSKPASQAVGQEAGRQAGRHYSSSSRRPPVLVVVVAC